MQTEETKTLECQNMFGEKRKYTFKLIDAEDGIWLLHRFGSVLSEAYETISPVLGQFFGNKEREEMTDEDEIKLVYLLRLLPQVFDWGTVKEISKKLLPNTVIEIGDESFTADESGFSPIAKGDPIEHYLMLLYSLAANFPKYIDFLGLALDSKEDKEGESQSQ